MKIIRFLILLISLFLVFGCQSNSETTTMSLQERLCNNSWETDNDSNTIGFTFNSDDTGISYNVVDGKGEVNYTFTYTFEETGEDTATVNLTMDIDGRTQNSKMDLTFGSNDGYLEISSEGEKYKFLPVDTPEIETTEPNSNSGSSQSNSISGIWYREENGLQTNINLDPDGSSGSVRESNSGNAFVNDEDISYSYSDGKLTIESAEPAESLEQNIFTLNAAPVEVTSEPTNNR